jgi:hypothetical protein
MRKNMQLKEYLEEETAPVMEQHPFLCKGTSVLVKCETLGECTGEDLAWRTFCCCCS